MKSNRQFAIILAILVSVLVISVPAFLIVPSAKGDAQVSRFPLVVGDWQGRDLSIDAKSYEVLETRNLILREYQRGEDKVYLYIIYSHDNRKVSHPPEVCFEGSGITVVSKEKMTLELAAGNKISANELFVEKGGVTNEVLYWYKAGRYYIDSYLKQQLKIALARLQFKHLSGALIRVSAEIAPSQGEKAIDNIRVFVKEASAYFDQVIP